MWQAEENLVNGKWERFYGFVGRYQMEKVPAAEIRFGNGWAGENVTTEISGRIESPIERHDGEEINLSFCTRHFEQTAEPLPFAVKIKNLSGLDQEVPAGLLLPPSTNKTLPLGIKLSLSFSAKIPPRVQRFTEPEFDYGEWHDLPLRQEVAMAANQAAVQMLVPTQEATILSADLSDYFEVGRPGSYRMKVFFRVPGQTEGQSNEIVFSVAEPAR